MSLLLLRCSLLVCSRLLLLCLPFFVSCKTSSPRENIILVKTPSRPSSPPFVPTPSEGEPVFTRRVHEVWIDIDTDLLPLLRLDSEERVPARFQFDGEVLESVGIRLKGHLGSGREINEKASFSLKFDSFFEGQRLWGLSKLILNNEVQDPGFASRQLSYEIWRRAGVPAPRCSYAKVWLNGEYVGLYTAEEAYGKDFLRRNFVDPSGNLYEGQGSDVSNVAALDLDTNEEENDRSDLIDLAEVLAQPDEAFLNNIDRYVNLAQFYSYWAVERLVYHWDGYGTVLENDDCCSPNNYYIYHDPTDGRFVFLPRGTDGLFRNVYADLYRPPAPKASLAWRLFSVAQEQLVDAVETTLDTTWDVSSLQDYLAMLAAEILLGFEEGGREEYHLGQIESMLLRYHHFLEARPTEILSQIAAHQK